jgi:hypothetical protein
MAGDPSFTIPTRPQRRYPYSGGVEYEGQTIFRLVPDEKRSEAELTELLEKTLSEGPYRYGDFHDLPLVLYLVCDEETGDVFRASVRDGSIRLHVLPETGSGGLRAMYDRLDARGKGEWHVECQASE